MIRLIVIAAVLALVAAVARWLALRSRSRVFWEDRCAACGYIVQGLPGHVCPECGADLRRAGAVLPPGVVPGLSYDWIFVIWSAALGLAYTTVERYWLGETDPIVVVEASGSFDKPMAGSYDGFAVTYAGEMYRGTPLWGRFELTLRLTGGGEARMVVDPITWSYHTTAGSARIAAPSGFGADALAQWLSAYGIDTSEPKARQALDGVESNLRDWCVSRSRSGLRGFWSSRATSSALTRATRTVKGVRGGFALTWLVGAVWLWRRSASPKVSAAVY